MNRVALTVVSLAALGLSLSPALALEPARSLNPSSGSTVLLAQANRVETVLFFETASMVVRVYRSDGSMRMNLYNKATDVVELRGAPTQLLPSTDGQTVYQTGGEAQRFARLDDLGNTELEIVAANGIVVLKEPGFNAVVGVPSGSADFRGNNFAPGTPALVLSAEAARLRSAPSLDSDILGLARRSAVVEVIERVGNPRDNFIWYQVTYQGVTGWVRGDLLQPT
jgi:uncharacterized protein YgiM (DUF1202 family)